MNYMVKIAIIFTTILAIQSLLTIYQIRYYSRFLRNLTRKYSGNKGYTLRTEVYKKKLSSIIVAVVCDELDRVVEMYFYQGSTFFSKFKRCTDYDGKVLEYAILKGDNSKENIVLKKLIDSYYKGSEDELY